MPDAPATPPSPLAKVRFDKLDIIYWPDPRLLRKSDPVTVFDESLMRLTDRMFELMRRDKGVGLAAPQVGINLRLFVINPTGEEGDDRVYINPEITLAEGAEEFEEGCLSLPEIRLNVNRPTAKATIKAQDLAGNGFEQTETGFITRIWQHENDHLNGVLILNWMGPLQKMQFRKKLRDLEEEYAEAQKPKKPKLRLPF